MLPVWWNELGRAVEGQGGHRMVAESAQGEEQTWWRLGLCRLEEQAGSMLRSDETTTGADGLLRFAVYRRTAPLLDHQEAGDCPQVR